MREFTLLQDLFVISAPNEPYHLLTRKEVSELVTHVHHAGDVYVYLPDDEALVGPGGAITACDKVDASLWVEKLPSTPMLSSSTVDDTDNAYAV